MAPCRLLRFQEIHLKRGRQNIKQEMKKTPHTNLGVHPTLYLPKACFLSAVYLDSGWDLAVDETLIGFSHKLNRQNRSNGLRAFSIAQGNDQEE